MSNDLISVSLQAFEVCWWQWHCMPLWAPWRPFSTVQQTYPRGTYEFVFTDVHGLLLVVIFNDRTGVRDLLMAMILSAIMSSLTFIFNRIIYRVCLNTCSWFAYVCFLQVFEVCWWQWCCPPLWAPWRQYLTVPVPYSPWICGGAFGQTQDSGSCSSSAGTNHLLSVVVYWFKFFACGTRILEFELGSRHNNFRDWVSPASKSRYNSNIAIATLILKTCLPLLWTFDLHLVLFKEGAYSAFLIC